MKSNLVAETLKGRKLFVDELRKNLRTKKHEVYCDVLEGDSGVMVVAEDADETPVAVCILDMTEAEFEKLGGWLIRSFRQSAAAVARRLKVAV